MLQRKSRWMVSSDYPAVARIDGCSFAEPWEIVDFRRELRQRNAIGRVIVLGDKVVAYMVYLLHKRAFEIRRFAVDPDFRRMRLAYQLAHDLKLKLMGARRTRIVIDVPERCLDAQLFLRSASFRCYTIERGSDGENDVFRFEYRPSSDSHLAESIVGDTSNQNT